MTTVHTSWTMFCQPASSSMAASMTHTCFPVGRPQSLPAAPCHLLPVREPRKHSPRESGWSDLGWERSRGSFCLAVPLGCSLTLSHSLLHFLSGQLCDNWPHNVREYLQLLLRKGMEGVGRVYPPPDEMEPARGRRQLGTVEWKLAFWARPERSTGSQPLGLAAAAEPLERCVFTLFPNTRLPRTFLLIMPSLWRISG